MATVFVLALAATSQAGELKIRHLYELSDFTGQIPYSDVILHVDRQNDEVYGVVGNTVRLFNGAGMEIYRFEYDSESGRIFDLVVEPSGDMILLTHVLNSGRAGTWSLVRCDYRGEPIGPIDLSGFPPEFAGFSPNVMVYREGLIYLASKQELQVVIVDGSGAFRNGYDLARLLALDDPGKHEILGFDVSASGDLLFTIPVLFHAFVVSPDGTVRQFGAPGSAPGKFGIVSGIADDDHGQYLVADKLRRVVMVFDGESLELVTEIGGKDDKYTLVRPTQLAVGNSNRVYITQAQHKGVTVFSLTPGGTGSHSNGDLALAATKGGPASTTVTNSQQATRGTASDSGTTVLQKSD